MSSVQVGDKRFVSYISEKEIDAAVEKVAAQINEEYRNDIPVILIVLNGSIIFGADLLKKLTIPCKVSCVRVSSYEGTQSTEKVKTVVGISEDIENQRVLLIEDIVDTGNTYVFLHQMLLEKGVKDVKIATMTFKPDSYRKGLPVDFVGLEIDNKFIVGRGLDYDGLGRNLPEIYQVVED